ncbi:MAG: hypothetical protein ACFHWX_20245 [Bacteroidota bacterium]|jgi:hypothetical protein
MTKTFTENDLIRFLYNELEHKESEEIERAILTDQVLQEQINKLRKLMEDMDDINVAPSKRTIKKILEFSKGYEIHSA